MRKVLFLMFLLLLMGLGAAGVKAQVRIGGNTPPNPAAALDLNADDSATPAGNKGALALPRVSLASATAQLNNVTPITGMLVYNTNTSMINGNGVGIYYWNGSSWIPVAPAPVKQLYALELVVDTVVTGPAEPAGTAHATPVLNLTSDLLCYANSAIIEWSRAPQLHYSYWDAGTATGTGWGSRVRCFRLVLTI